MFFLNFIAIWLLTAKSLKPDSGILLKELIITTYTIWYLKLIYLFFNLEIWYSNNNFKIVGLPVILNSHTIFIKKGKFFERQLIDRSLCHKIKTQDQFTFFNYFKDNILSS